MRLLSSTSTSSAQVEGQSCGQAEAPILGPCGRGRTVWFMVRASYSALGQGDILRHRPRHVYFSQTSCDSPAAKDTTKRLSNPWIVVFGGGLTRASINGGTVFVWPTTSAIFSKTA